MITSMSCGESQEMNNDNPEEEYMTITIDGTELTTTLSLVSANPDNTGFYSILGNGFGEDDSRIMITLQSPTSEGDFEVSENEVSISYISGTTIWYADISRGSGSLSITENNSENMKGTFSFLGISANTEESKEITNGSFTAKKF